MSSVNGGSACNSYWAAARSLPPFESQARTSATRAGSCRMEESSLANDSGRQGRGQMQAAIELAGGPNQHVGGNPGAPERNIGSAAAAEFGWRVVRHDDHNVVVAVRPGVSPGNGTEQVDALRTVRFHQTAHHLGQSGIAGRGSLENSGVIESHGSSLTQFATTGRHADPGPKDQRDRRGSATHRIYCGPRGRGASLLSWQGWLEFSAF